MALFFPPKPEKTEVDGEVSKRNKLTSLHCATPCKLKINKALCLCPAVVRVVAGISINTSIINCLRVDTALPVMFRQKIVLSVCKYCMEPLLESLVGSHSDPNYETVQQNWTGHPKLQDK